MTKSYDILDQLINLNKEDPEYNKNRMVLMVRYLQRYMETYSNQYHYENYSDSILIDDVLYGLGVVLDPKEHQFADGYDRWKQKLKQFFDGDENITEPVS